MTTRFRFPLLLALAATLLFACSSEDDSPSSGRPSAPDLGVLPDLDVSTSVDLAFLKPDGGTTKPDMTTTTGDPDMTTITGDPDMTTPPGEEAAPVIVELTASKTRLTRGQILEVTAIVTDPQGFGDIGGGRLFSEQGKLYGAFIGSGGTFKAALSWTAIQDIEATSFEMEQGIPVRAEFFDAALNKTSQTFMLTLHCDGSPACKGVCGESLCGEVCKTKNDFSEDDVNCGACGVSCASGALCVEASCECSDGKKVCGGSCVDVYNDAEHCGSCGTTCASGQACIAAACKSVVLPGSPCNEDEECINSKGIGSCVGSADKTCSFSCGDASDCDPGQMCTVSFPFPGLPIKLGQCTLP